MTAHLTACIGHIKSKQMSPEEAVVFLARTKLRPDEQSLVYYYCFPRPLLDRELMSRVKEEHRKNGDVENRGSRVPNNLDIGLILEAGQTQQYGRFIKHLMYSFCNMNSIFCVDDDGNNYECPICGKTLVGKLRWNPSSDLFMENVAIGSIDSSITMCADCIIQLTAAKSLMQELDPGFLDWTKRFKLN